METRDFIGGIITSNLLVKIDQSIWDRDKTEHNTKS